MRPDLVQTMPNVIVSVEQPVLSVDVESYDVRVDCVDQAINVEAEENVVTVLPIASIGGGTASDVIVRPAAATIHGQRAVMIVDGAFLHPDIGQPGHAARVIGVALQSGSAGSEIAVRTRGTISDPSWAWSPGEVWCGPGGVLTQALAPSGWVLVVGRAVDATTIDVDIDTPFYRAS